MSNYKHLPHIPQDKPIDQYSPGEIERINQVNQARTYLKLHEACQQSQELLRKVRQDLPCLYSNNSDKGLLKVNKLTGEVEANDDLNKLQPYQKRAAETLYKNCDSFISSIGINRVGFLTLTFPDNVKNHKEASRRFDNMRRRFLSVEFGAWMWVKERQKRGAWHYHLLIDCRDDIRTGFNFDDLARRKYSSANRQLRSLWNRLRLRLPSYGFGRSELLPIKTNVQGMARYVGKYINNHVTVRKPIDKGVRLTGYSSNIEKVKNWKTGKKEERLIYAKHSPNFAWNTDNAKKWRYNLKLFFTHVMGYPETMWADYYVTDPKTGKKELRNLATQILRDRFGKSWAYILQDDIMNIEATIERGYIARIRQLPDAPF